MGICSSCLGRGRRNQLEDPETSRLLSDDPFRSYGSRTQFPRRPDEPDPEHVRRETEALETNPDRSHSPEPDTNGFKEDDARAQSLAYRTVKRAHIDLISSPMGSSKHDWKDAKAALG
ncbi:MAG: hypothetical protein Q9182_001973 [Xanthomendoza sp. 2 TL-2023]